MSQLAPGWLIWPVLEKYFRWRGEVDGEKLAKQACRICIPLLGGCCVFPMYDGWKILVFPEEAKRIAEYTGKEISEFIDTSPLEQSQREYLITGCPDDPLWSRLFALWPKPSGLKDKCPFVSKNGCLLPYHVKPFICQTFPLDFNITYNTINFRDDMGCIMTHLTGSKDKIAACFGDHYEQLEERFQVFRGEFIKLLEMLEQQSARKP